MKRLSKRILSVLLCLSMLLAFVPVGVQAATTMNIRVTPSATNVRVGDTIEYVVTAEGSGVTAMEFQLIMPEGLEYVANSGAVPSGLKNYLGWVDVCWTESRMMWTGYSALPATFEKGTVIMTFSAIATAAGIYEVELFDLLPFDENYDDFEAALTVDAVTVAAAAVCEHSFTNYISNGDATCTVDGTKTAKCDKCDKTRTVVDEGSATGHNFQEGVCSLCGENAEPFADFYVSASMKNCTTVEYTIYVNGENLTALQFNLVIPDGMSYVPNSAVIPSGLRSYLGWAATDWTEQAMMWTGYNDLPSVFEEGTVVLTFTCTMDAPGSYEVELWELLAFDPDYCEFECTLHVDAVSFEGHSFTNYISNGDATCTVDGTKTAKCDRCDVVDTVTDEYSALGHRFTDYISDGNATCFKDGTKTAKCDYCDKTDTVVDGGSCTGHRYETVVTAPTCLTGGFTTYTCGGCGDSYVADETQALGHGFNHFVSDGNATCVADGTKTAKCDRCERRHTVPDEGSALGHSFTNYVSNGDATCTEDGTRTAKCDRCDQTHTVIEVGTAGHKMSYVSNNDATCTEDGTLTGTCSACGYSENVVDPGTATGHSFTNYVSNGNHTCTADGTKTAKCDNCDARDTVVDIGSAGHQFEHIFCVVCGELSQPDAVLTGTLSLPKNGDAQLTISTNGKILATMNAQSGAYTMAVWSGEFLLTVTMEGCVTREYAITLTEGQNDLDLKLHQYGDINGDGKINAGDVARIYAHIKKNKLLTGYELLCADYNGDGRLNVGDTSKIYGLVKK